MQTGGLTSCTGASSVSPSVSEGKALLEHPWAAPLVGKLHDRQRVGEALSARTAEHFGVPPGQGLLEPEEAMGGIRGVSC